jgi:HK97 family phage prohead protease
MTKHISLPRFGLVAHVRAESYSETSNTIDVVWSTGAKVRRNSWMDGPYDEQLSMDPNCVRLERLNAGAPFLDTHDAYDLDGVIGSVVPGSAKIANGAGVATIRLSSSPDDASVIQKIKEGIICNISVGYRIHKVVKTDGQDGDVPVWDVVDWEPLELSAVPIPADPGAQVRSDGASRNAPELFDCIMVRDDASAATAVIQKETEMAKANAAAAAETGGTQTNIEPGAERAAPDTRAAAPTPPSAADTKAIIEQERGRNATIADLAVRAGHRDFGDEHVRLGTSVEEFRVALFDKMFAEQEKLPQSTSHVRVIGESEHEKRATAIENALLHRHDPKAFVLTDHGRDFRGLTLLELARDFLDARGVRTRGMSKMEIASLALEQRSGGMMTTSDFPNVLANVANKTLRQGYDAAPQTFRPLIRETTVPDFKQVSRVQLGAAPKLEAVNEHGEFKRGSVGDSAEKYSVQTYGKIVAITRQVLVNDDLSAFTRIPRAFGVQAANLESDLVWAQITGNPNMADGVALFHANHANLGTAAALATAAVAAGRMAMSKQTDLDGSTLLNIVPAYLVVPAALLTVAEQFVGQIFPTKNTDTVPEALRRLQVVSDPRLDVVSGSNWFLAADPGQIDIVELAYLDGAQGVYTETRMGFDVDGIEVKVRLDVGAKVIDWRGLWKNPN